MVALSKVSVPVRSLVGVVFLLALVGLPCHVEAAAKRGVRVHVAKGARTIEVRAGDEVLLRFAASLGPGGAGYKTREGDRVTPVGRYHVTMHQPSQYRVFLRLDYPNAEDRARFARLKRDGALPDGATIGGDIGIHGPPVSMTDEEKKGLVGRDWTLGCVAVQDEEIKALAKLVPVGTEVIIED